MGVISAFLAHPVVASYLVVSLAVSVVILYTRTRGRFLAYGVFYEDLFGDILAPMFGILLANLIWPLTVPMYAGFWRGAHIKQSMKHEKKKKIEGKNAKILKLT